MKPHRPAKILLIKKWMVKNLSVKFDSLMVRKAGWPPLVAVAFNERG
jgi:hypothetical protein